MQYSEIPWNSMLKTGITFKDWPRESGVVMVWIKLVIGKNSPKIQVFQQFGHYPNFSFLVGKRSIFNQIEKNVKILNQRDN